MNISFFEEFTTPENLAKINLIPKSFGTKIYIAAHSLTEFQNFSKTIPLTLVYWLVLPKTDGYWISPFSKRKALLDNFNALKDKEIELMLDLENPNHARHLYFTELHNFYRNKYFLKKFIAQGTPKMTLVELPGREKRLKFWGLTYPSKTASIVKMVYTSLLPMSRDKKLLKLIRTCREGVGKYGTRFKIGLGCTATGVGGTEALLSPQELAEDIFTAKKCGVTEVVIFRLGGMTEEYVKAIHSKIVSLNNSIN